MKIKSIPALAAVLLGVAACQTVPREPVADILPARFPLSAPADAPGGADPGWRSVLRDPQLQRLIELALSESRPLRLAVLDAEAARAQLRIRNANRLPELQLEAGVDRGRTVDSSGGANAHRPAEFGTAGVQLGVAAFELDLFGRVRGESRSASEAFLAADAGRYAAQSVVIATVAQAYVAHRAAAERLSLMQATVARWRSSLELGVALRAAGRSSDLDIAQAESRLRSAESDAEAARRAVHMTTNTLALVVGTPLPSGLPEAMALSEAPILTHIPAGLPSDLLFRRPDIRQAEHRLAAADADVEAARAAFFPRISLTGFLGLAGGDLGSLFGGSAGVWSFVPRLTAGVFLRGRLKGEMDLAEVRADQAVAQYELTVQTAFREVADGLAGRATFTPQLVAQKAAVHAAERRLMLTRRSFEGGTSDQLDLLDAERNLYTAHLALIDVHEQQALSAVRLYSALGGGVGRRSAAGGRPLTHLLALAAPVERRHAPL